MAFKPQIPLHHFLFNMNIFISSAEKYFSLGREKHIWRIYKKITAPLSTSSTVKPMFN